MALLETRDLSKSFGGLQAIDKVSLKVEPNTIHGLIGPNGSGKSTFFNLLTGVYQPDEGSHISFDGVDITNSPAHTIAGLGLARTFQLLRLYGELSVLDNVMVGYHPHTKYGPLAPLFNGAEVRRQDKAVRDEMQELLEFIGLFSHSFTSRFRGLSVRLLEVIGFIDIIDNRFSNHAVVVGTLEYHSTFLDEPLTGC